MARRARVRTCGAGAASDRVASLCSAACAALLGLAAAASPGGAQATGQEWSAARYDVTLLDDGSDAWHHASLEVGARRARLTPIARAAYASRFGQESFQLEGDLYPTWPGVGYAYLSAAWSPGAPFPDLRLAVEAFAGLPRGFEASAGIVHLDFDGERIPIVLGSVSKYFGSYSLSVRPYWLPRDSEVAVAGVLRRYLTAADEHMTLRLVRGSAPETLATAADADRLESLTIRFDAQLRVTDRWLLLPAAELNSEDLPSGSARLRTTIGIGAMYVF